MKLLVDMNLSPAWVAYLAKHGIPAIHWSTVGNPAAPDTEIFEYARTHELVIFTHDLDFTTMLALARTHRPSLVQARVQDVAIASLGPSLIAALGQCARELENGAVVTLLPHRNKVRVLPL